MYVFHTAECQTCCLVSTEMINVFQIQNYINSLNFLLLQGIHSGAFRGIASSARHGNNNIPGADCHVGLSSAASWLCLLWSPWRWWTCLQKWHSSCSNSDGQIFMNLSAEMWWWSWLNPALLNSSSAVRHCRTVKHSSAITQFILSHYHKFNCNNTLDLHMQTK